MKIFKSALGWSLASVFVMQACDRGSQEKPASAQDVRQEQLDQDKAWRDEIIGALKKSHNADDTWNRGVNNLTWTADLQARVVGKPIVSSGLLVDVWLGQDGKYYLHLTQSPSMVQSMLGGARFDFVLTCAKPEKIAPNVKSFPEYFFVAKAQSVEKSQVFSSNELNFSKVTEGPRFTIRGQCLDLRLNVRKSRLEQGQNGLRPGTKKYLDKSSE